MIFETIKRNAQAQQRRVILADPESLRELANRLETAASFARDGESVSCDLTQDVLILFKPEPTMAVSGLATEFQAQGKIEGVVTQPDGRPAPHPSSRGI